MGLFIRSSLGRLTLLSGQIDMVFAPVDPSIKEKVISAHLAGHGRNQIDREMAAQGIKISHGSISNIINAYKRKHEQPPQPSPSNDDNAGISTGISMNIDAGSPLLMARCGIGKATSDSFVTPRDGGPLSWFTTEIKSDYQPAQPVATETQPQEDVKELAPDKPRAESERRLEQERNIWGYYGPAWYSLMNQMKNEKDRRRHELLMLDRRKSKLEQREQELQVRESRVFEAEPFLSVAKELENLRMGMEDPPPQISAWALSSSSSRLSSSSSSSWGLKPSQHVRRFNVAKSFDSLSRFILRNSSKA